MTAIGLFCLIIAFYGVFSTYRLIKHRELQWHYPFIRDRKRRDYSQLFISYVSVMSGLGIAVFLYLAFIFIFPKQ